MCTSWHLCGCGRRRKKNIITIKKSFTQKKRKTIKITGGVAMDSIGGFHEVENDGKLFLVYHHPKYNTIPQTQSPTSSDEAASHDLPFQPLFLCPFPRILKEYSDSLTFPVSCSPEYVGSTEQEEDHPVLPLFWCNNKELDDGGGCRICRGLNFGTDYYFCVYHGIMFHKECVQSPFQIKHPYHPEHSLQLSYRDVNAPDIKCLSCGRRATDLVYYCTICEAIMHTVCAMKSIPFVEDQPKSHDHPLTFFPRQASLTCNVCGLLRKNNPTYICTRCNFVAHNDCMFSPRIIKISRHHHRISYVSSLPSGEWSCGVCRQNINSSYGSYTCDKCGDYAVHSRCALRKDVWDRVELEGVPEKEEDDIIQDDGPFEMISKGVILHFLHDHHLRLEVSVLYDENKLCQACVLPIYEGNLYSCVECDFIIHETCAKNRCRIQHALHPHPLALKAISKYRSGAFKCNACYRNPCCGFVYMCLRKECDFDLDVRCASISEPFDYQGHEHPLFLALGPEEKPICQVCKSESHIPLNCIKCDFIVCIKYATLPYEARYKCDKHFLKVLCGEEVYEKDWCEACERNLGDTDTKVIYWCNECSTTLHVECLLGKDPYMKPGQYSKLFEGKEVQILGKSPVSRPFCDNCKNPCQGRIYKNGNLTACSRKCGIKIF